MTESEWKAKLAELEAKITELHSAVAARDEKIVALGIELNKKDAHIAELAADAKAKKADAFLAGYEGALSGPLRDHVRELYIERDDGEEYVSKLLAGIGTGKRPELTAPSQLKTVQGTVGGGRIEIPRAADGSVDSAALMARMPASVRAKVAQFSAMSSTARDPLATLRALARVGTLDNILADEGYEPLDKGAF